MVRVDGLDVDHYSSSTAHATEKSWQMKKDDAIQTLKNWSRKREKGFNWQTENETKKFHLKQAKRKE